MRKNLKKLVKKTEVALNKTPQVSWPTATFIIALAAYTTAVLTALAMEDQLAERLSITILIGVTVLTFMTIMFVLSQIISRTDVVDAAWGLAFMVAALGAFVINGKLTFDTLSVQVLVLGLVIIWGLRLAYSIVIRLLSHPEDKRYVALRKKWKGSVTINTYLRIFALQAVLATLISIGVIHVMISPEQSIGAWAIAGAVVWLIGFIFEVVGDLQLKKFISNPKNKGKIMTKGLWKYTRHPNYFGEATMWWGIFIIALSTPYGWVAIATPALITYLLLFVSGVPMTEKSGAKKKGWKEYAAKTSIFLPLPPKS